MAPTKTPMRRTTPPTPTPPPQGKGTETARVASAADRAEVSRSRKLERCLVLPEAKSTHLTCDHGSHTYVGGEPRFNPCTPG